MVQLYTAVPHKVKDWTMLPETDRDMRHHCVELSTGSFASSFMSFIHGIMHGTASVDSLSQILESLYITVWLIIHSMQYARYMYCVSVISFRRNIVAYGRG